MRTQAGSYDNDGEGRYRRLRPGPGLSRDRVAADQRARLRRAVIEIVAVDGYETLTVRRLAKRARISSATLYKHYRSPDDCFLAAFDLVCRRLSERMLQAGEEELELRRRLNRAVQCLFQAMAAAPQVACFMLRAAPAAGPGFASRLQDSVTQVGLALGSCLCPKGEMDFPPLLLDGLVAGLARIGRAHLLEPGEGELGRIPDEATDWILSLLVPSVAAADAVTRFAAGTPSPARSSGGGWRAAPGDDRAMILAAAFRVGRMGYHELSVPRVCREAGVPRRDFNRHFHSLEECFCSALEERVADSAAIWREDADLSASWSDAVGEGLRTLGEAIEDDFEGARLLFAETSSAGTPGIDSWDRQISQVARTLRASAPEETKPSELTAEASTAAAWSLLRRALAGKSPPSGPGFLSPLVHLILAPAERRVGALDGV